MCTSIRPSEASKIRPEEPPSSVIRWAGVRHYQAVGSLEAIEMRGVIRLSVMSARRSHTHRVRQDIKSTRAFIGQKQASYASSWPLRLVLVLPLNASNRATYPGNSDHLMHCGVLRNCATSTHCTNCSPRRIHMQGVG
jgi:hypothetical protein